MLTEGAASLLPDGPRPAVIFTVRVAPDGAVQLDGAERAVIRSRAKLAYETATDADLPAGFADLADRIAAAEDRRGAARVDPPEQEVERRATALRARRSGPRRRRGPQCRAVAGDQSRVADALLAHRTGLFRVMAPPDDGRSRACA